MGMFGDIEVRWIYFSIHLLIQSEFKIFGAVLLVSVTRLSHPFQLLENLFHKKKSTPASSTIPSPTSFIIQISYL